MAGDARSRTAKAALVLVATFVLGAAAGAGLSRWSQRPLGPPPGGGPIPMHELDLSPTQRDRVDEILQSHRGEVEAILDESRPRLDEINERVISETREVLTDAQNRRLDELRSRPRPGPPPGPAGPPRRAPPPRIE